MKHALTLSLMILPPMLLLVAMPSPGSKAVRSQESRIPLKELPLTGPGLNNRTAVLVAARGDVLSASASPDLPDPKTVLPPPVVEMDVVKLLAEFPREERPYVQQVVHTIKELAELNKQCAEKAALFAQRGLPKNASRNQLDLADVTSFNDSYLRYFDPLRQYMRVAYKRLYAMMPPPRFQKAHKYWLAYLAFALENLDHMRVTDKTSSLKPEHSPIEVAQYRAWAYRLFKENGLDLTPYLVNAT